MQKDEIKHDVDSVLGCSPSMVEGYLGPASFREYLYHDILGVYEWFKIWKLSVLIVSRGTVGCIETVEHLHADYAKNIEEEKEHRHKL